MVVERWRRHQLSTSILANIKNRIWGTAAMAKFKLRVNGKARTVDASDADKPLLYVLRGLGLTAAKDGCGLGQCGACTVLVDGSPVRSCVTAVGSFGASEVTTIEGLGTIATPHPLQRAFMEEQAAQCGYCINGMIMAAKPLLDRTAHPSEEAVRSALAGNLGRCGTHGRIIRAVLRAAEEMERN
jgi:nicotinate dehydrogenase subunit A